MNKTNLLRLICLMGFITLGVIQVGYAWSGVENGVAICTASGSKINKQQVSDGHGGAIITWEDTRNDDGDIYAQAIDKAGNVKWNMNGVAVCTAMGYQRLPKIVSDDQGGAIITWRDFRNGSADIYAQAIDSIGEIKWLPLEGVAISTATTIPYEPSIISDGQGGAIITWYQSDNFFSGDKVYAQAIDSSGKIKWTTNGLAICTIYTCHNDGISPQLVTDGQGGAIITWYDQRWYGERNDDGDIYAQAIDSTGSLKWTLNGVAICTAYEIQRYPAIATDGQGGAIITWQDYRASNDDGTYENIYAQAINSNGTVKWTQNGVAVCTVMRDQQLPQIVSDDNNGALVAWVDNRHYLREIFIQSINENGLIRWTFGGVAICTTSSDQENQQLIPDGQGGAIITWDDYRDGPLAGGDIYAQAIDSTGKLQWDLSGYVICTASGAQNRSQLVSVENGEVIVSWEGSQNSTYNIYAQSFYVHTDNVQDVMVTPGNKEVKLVWTNPLSSKYFATKILRRTDRYPTNPTDGTVIYWYNGTVCLDTGLTNGQTYYYGLFTHDTAYSYATGVFKSAYLYWQPNEGLFSAPADTANWAFQQPENVSQMPAYSWLSSYSGHTGVLKINYSDMTEGLKLTAVNRLYNGAVNNWYHIRVQYASDSPNHGHEIISQLLSYPTHQSNSITEVGGNWTGKGQIIPNRWYTYDAYVYSKESSQQIQLILKNNGSSGAFYIDSIQCDSTQPPAIVSPIAVPMTVGDFDTVNDTTGWGFQNTSDSVNGMASLAWNPFVDNHNGTLDLCFSQVSQGIKMTSIDTYNVSTNRNVVLSFCFKSNFGYSTALQVFIYLYGEQDLATFKVDLSAKGYMKNLVDGYWYNAYVPLTSVSGNTSFRLQLVVKNNTHDTGWVYLDSAQLYYSPAISATTQWVELLDEPRVLFGRM